MQMRAFICYGGGGGVVIAAVLLSLSVPNGEAHHLCLAVYRFPKGRVPTAVPHGNSKSKAPFHPTWPSTMQKIKQESIRRGPKETVNRVSRDSGGMVAAVAPGKLPRGEHQVTNVRHGSKQFCSSGGSDDLFVVMSECKSKDANARFIRDVKAAPDPAVVLATDRQLDDIIRFGTSPEEFCVVTVDPTFNLGDFDVTPMTYRHLLLESERTKKPPVFVGPIMVHYRKTFQAYLYFASTLIGLRPQLEKLLAYGTDGEQTLVDALSHEFPFAVHLTCTIHLRRNVKQQLIDRKFPEEHRRLTLEEVFGAKRGMVHFEGLIDSSTPKEFDEKLVSLKIRWEQREASSSECNRGFYDWFLTNKAEVLKSSAIKPVREQAGLGSPPDLFSTNASESVNNVIKSKVDYKKNELYKFIEKMQCLVNDQDLEVERAVCCRGKYRFRPQYQYLEIAEEKWFKMTPEARRKHISKIHQTVVVAAPSLGTIESGTLPSSSTSSCSNPTLSLELKSFSSVVKTPQPVLEGIWRKATELVSTPQKIALAPGCSALARMVESKSGKRPHLVTPGKGGKFACDNSCPNYKCFGLCSHTVAVAEVNGMLSAYIEYYKKQKKIPNLSALAKTGMPTGRGRKGTEPPRKRRRGDCIETRVPFNPTLEVDAELPRGSANSYPQNVPSTPAANQLCSCSQGSSFVSAPHGYASYQLVTVGAHPDITRSSMVPSAPPPLHPSAACPETSFGPPPLIPCHNVGTVFNVLASQVSPPGSNSSRSFNLHFICGNISRCAGCKGNYVKPASPPFDLCIQHEEWRQVTYANSTTPSSIFSNTYYHPSLHCLRVNWPLFEPTQLVIPPTVAANLQKEHWDFLQNSFHYQPQH